MHTQFICVTPISSSELKLGWFAVFIHIEQDIIAQIKAVHQDN